MVSGRRPQLTRSKRTFPGRYQRSRSLTRSPTRPRAYQPGDSLDKRRKLMDAWALYCESPAVSGNITRQQRSPCIRHRLTRSKMADSTITVQVRHQWNDWRLATFRIGDVSGWHWDNKSGGVNSIAPQFFVHAYVWCNAMLDGELAHSCSHGSGPHRIKVCLTKTGNEKAWEHMLALAGPRPQVKRRRVRIRA